MNHNEPYSGPERRAHDRSLGFQLRRRQNEAVEHDRRRTRESGVDIAAALEMHLDQVKTRRSMIQLLERWLSEARTAQPTEQDPEYIEAVEHAIEVIRREADLETAICMLQRREPSTSAEDE